MRQTSRSGSHNRRKKADLHRRGSADCMMKRYSVRIGWCFTWLTQPADVLDGNNVFPMTVYNIFLCSSSLQCVTSENRMKWMKYNNTRVCISGHCVFVVHPSLQFIPKILKNKAPHFRNELILLTSTSKAWCSLFQWDRLLSKKNTLGSHNTLGDTFLYCDEGTIISFGTRILSCCRH